MGAACPTGAGKIPGVPRGSHRVLGLFPLRRRPSCHGRGKEAICQSHALRLRGGRGVRKQARDAESRGGIRARGAGRRRALARPQPASRAGAPARAPGARRRSHGRSGFRAQGVLEALYKDQPSVLGIVRATVDFYWRNKMPDLAVNLLVRAAGSSYPGLKKQFLFEAARKSTEARQYARARELLAPLLLEDPFNGEYLAALADTHARAGEDQALRDFYAAKIQEMRSAPLSTEDRTARIASLRRGLILALTRLKDYAAAVDQYVEVINRYPEDEALVQEAAAYALEHQRQPQLAGYYRKTAADSPRDFRWPMVLARLQTHFEDFPAAIEAWTRASEIRPERAEFYSARARLEERLMRFEEAAATYSTLYERTYRNPQWMEKIAEVRARQGQTDAAVQALQRALVEGRPQRPDIYFRVAGKLESWNMLDQARQFAERGLDLAGKDLLVDQDYVPGART